MKNQIHYLLGVVLLMAISGCVKDKFDEPPVGGSDPNIKTTITISQIKARFTGSPYQFTDSSVVAAVVVGDDKSGNLYKALAIEDSTGGITLTISGSGLFNQYPVGRRLFIKLNGLYVAQYKGLYEIIGSINPDGSYAGIPPTNASQFIYPGKWGINVAPKVVTISQLNDAYQSELIQFNNVEFSTGDRNAPYANGAPNYLSVSHTLKDCNGGAVVVYTSGYADFASSLTPSGNGTFSCIYSVYNGTPQLIVRDTTDIALTGPNCNAQHSITIASLRAMYTGAPVILPAGTSISGTVISDGASGNINSKNMFIQDNSGGMSIRFSAAHSFALGAKLTIDLSGDSLISYKGGLEVTPVAVGNAVQNGTGSITPRVVTIAYINANESILESTLVQIDNASINGGVAGTYSGSQSLNDGTTSADVLYTASTANFASTSYPTGTVTVTCIVSEYNGIQLQLRNANDVH